MCKEKKMKNKEIIPNTHTAPQPYSLLSDENQQ